MKSYEYEQCLLGAVLRHSDVIKLLATELASDKFSYSAGGQESSAHRLIYDACVACHLRKVPPDPVSVARELGENLEDAGGMSYLRELTGILPSLGVTTVNEDSIRNWARIVDNIGRLRHLSGVLDGYAAKLADRERALAEVEDVDLFIADIIADLWEAQGLTRTDYKHISVGVASYRRRLRAAYRGEVTEVAPIGWPSFRDALLPYMGGMTVIAGLPGAGKTQLALQIMLGQMIQAKHQGIQGCAAVNSYEMTDWRLVRRLAACLAGVDAGKVSAGDVGEDTPEAERLEYWLGFVEGLPIYVNDNNLTTSSRINWQASVLHAVHGPLLNLIVDYAERVPISKAEERESRERQREVFTTVYLILVFSGLILSGIVLIFRSSLATSLLGANRPEWIAILAAIMLFDTLWAIPMHLFRADERPLPYITLSLVNVFITMGLNILLVAHYRMGVAGALMANLVASATLFLVTLISIVPRLSLTTVSTETAKRLLRFGLPLLLAGLFTVTLELADRYLLSFTL